jgi:RNA polymerase sigma-70 factor (ECF subfamily)
MASNKLPQTLTDQLYTELRRLAAWYIASESPGHTLQPTALVHEAYVRLAGDTPVDGITKSQFMALAGRVMRNVLVDHARKRNADKRGGGEWTRIALDAKSSDQNANDFCADIDVLALHDALEQLAVLSERQARVVESRFFAGLSVQQTAEALDVSPRTVEADWALARVWLARALSRSQDEQRPGDSR